ncbi:hypothetical protein H5410_063563, partial [Solanum commersonii]
MVGTRSLDMDIWYRHPRRTCQAFSCLIFRSRTLDKVTLVKNLGQQVLNCRLVICSITVCVNLCNKYKEIHCLTEHQRAGYCSHNGNVSDSVVVHEYPPSSLPPTQPLLSISVMNKLSFKVCLLHYCFFLYPVLRKCMVELWIVASHIRQCIFHKLNLHPR